MKNTSNNVKAQVAKSNLLFMKKGFKRLVDIIILGKKRPKKKYVSRKMRAALMSKLDNWRKRYLLLLLSML